MKTIISTEDTTLLDWCKSGKQQGYTGLYQKYAKLVFNSIYRLLNDRVQSEDVLQDVFVKGFSEIRSLKSAESFGSWIKKIAINQSLSYLRKSKIHFASVDEIQIEDNSDEMLEEQQKINFRIEEIQYAITQLPRTERIVVNLFLFEDVPQEEIGKMLNIPPGTIRSHYHRAKKKIFEQLKQKENERSA